MNEKEFIRQVKVLLRKLIGEDIQVKQIRVYCHNQDSYHITEDGTISYTDKNRGEVNV